MSSTTHTHRAQGGRFALVAETPGSGPLDGQMLMTYHDLDKDVHSVTTADDWRQHWRPIAPDDCTVCLGTGHDQIKGNKRQPCGGCYGLGKVKEDGSAPSELWDLADVARRIIGQQALELIELRNIVQLTEVQGFLHKRHAESEKRGLQKEREWREGPGHGPGGKRYSGD